MSVPGGGGGGGGGTAMRGRVSTEQLELLLAFMEEHLEFALGKQSVYSRYSASKLWRLLAERLNAAAAAGADGTRKSPDKWCRYWADLKYKARKKCASGDELSHMEERLRALLGGGGAARVGGGVPVSPDAAGAGDEDGASLGSAAGAPDELLAEAAMRQALASEKMAEAVAQGVELLRELVCVVRERLPPPPPPSQQLDTLAANNVLHHHHHRL